MTVKQEITPKRIRSFIYKLVEEQSELKMQNFYSDKN